MPFLPWKNILYILGVLTLILMAVVEGYIVATKYIMMLKAHILQTLMQILPEPLL